MAHIPTGLDDESRFRSRLILVHGIQSDGLWMDQAEPLLSPFFTIIKVPYKHFRHAGALKLLFEPYSLVAGLVVAWLLALYWPGELWLGLLFLVLGVTASHLLSRRLLESALEHFVTQFSTEAELLGRPTHVIAHSLGTFLTTEALNRYQGIHLGRIVLCGCVLPRTFPWDRLRGNPSAGTLTSRVESIRNEVGLRDPVPLLARWSRLLGGPPFGDSGRKGFLGDGSLVHNIPQGFTQCPQCPPGHDALVHNVYLDFAHSSVFVGANQCKNFWLPFLLRCDPAEFRLLLMMCVACSNTRGRSLADIDAAESELREYPWRWCGGRLDGEIRKRLSEYPHVQAEELDSLVDAAVYVFYRSVAQAESEPHPGGNPQVLEALSPTIALQRSVKAIMDASVG